MASSKLSALTALTSVGDDDLVYVADTADSGSTYSSKKVTKANLFSGYATESYVSTQISNLIDNSPSALNTLNELAAALNDDASFSTTITNLIDANETHIDNVATLSGVAKDSANLGTFTGSTIADSQTIKQALQALETAVENAGSATSLSAATTDISDLQTLTGIADGNSDLGTFSGSTIADSTDIKTALQALETAVEGNTGGATTVNVVSSATNANHYLTFVDSDNTSGTQETVYTDAGVYYNPYLNQFNANGVNTGVLSLSGVDVTTSAAELNVLDGATAGSAVASKALVVDASRDLDNLATVTATSFVGALTGNVTGNVTGSSGSCTGNAATASQVSITPELSSSTTHYVAFAEQTLTTTDLHRDTGITYVPSTNTLTATNLVVSTGLTIGSTALSATAAELNYVDGVTSNIQTQLDAKTADGDNVNVLVGSTSADSVPQSNGADNYLFLVVDKANGGIKAIDKNFIEAEG